MGDGQRSPNAAARLAALPLVASARAKLSVVYSGTKCSHPSLRSACERLERCVTVVLSPVVDKLEPHVSIANDVACKSLDWLETVFPMLLTATEQLVATAKDKVAEIQDVVSIAANGSADCVNMGVAWLVRLEVAQDRAGQPLVDRAIAAAAVGVDSALTMSEALVDQMLPPTEDKEETEAVQGLEPATLRSFLERLFALTTKMYESTLGFKSRFTLIWTIQDMPQYLYHQLVFAVSFLSRMQSYPTSKRQRFGKRSRPRGPEIAYMDSIQMLPYTTPPTCRLRKTSKSPTFEECSVKGCVGR